MSLPTCLLDVVWFIAMVTPKLFVLRLLNLRVGGLTSACIHSRTLLYYVCRWAGRWSKHYLLAAFLMSNLIECVSDRGKRLSPKETSPNFIMVLKSLKKIKHLVSLDKPVVLHTIFRTIPACFIEVHPSLVTIQMRHYSICWLTYLPSCVNGGSDLEALGSVFKVWIHFLDCLPDLLHCLVEKLCSINIWLYRVY